MMLVFLYFAVGLLSAISILVAHKVTDCFPDETLAHMAAVFSLFAWPIIDTIMIIVFIGYTIVKALDSISTAIADKFKS